ncbi:hypothetical protein [Aliidiomarina sanyensis]|uniref:Uncharacterized protein n=1 Tax=Aliidiomarina sanyensis TaxID=1249555 RepID=A0A432WBP4_9GAMM|nr:hypothetical protein [Aliidiomarina sanyensis]RUO29494.1 hypothetical protein CWE11_09610 [Aliidiomarina sanyensis]
MQRIYWAVIVVLAAGLLLSAIPWYGIYTFPMKYPNVFFGDWQSVLTSVGQVLFILLPIIALIGALRERFYFFTSALLHTFIASFFNVSVIYGLNRVPLDLGPLNAHPIWVVNGMVAIGILVLLTLGRGVNR